MIDSGSIAGLLEYRDELAAHCPRCELWRMLPLAHLIANGKGSLRLPVKVRCIECGERGRLQLRTPVLTRGDSVDRIAPT